MRRGEGEGKRKRGGGKEREIVGGGLLRPIDGHMRPDQNRGFYSCIGLFLGYWMKLATPAASRVSLPLSLSYSSPSLYFPFSQSPSIL